MTSSPTLLTDPFLQLPTESSVRVVWFTEFKGTHHTVRYGKGLAQSVQASTTQLYRTREDADSNLANPPTRLTPRPIWRHEAEVPDLAAGKRLPYQVASTREDGAIATSKPFTLAPKPSPGQALKVLLTSDHQLKPMVAANLQKVAETAGRLDLVLLAGDLVNIPDRASEWFDDANGGAFFPALQGRASYELEKDGVKTRYTGAEILQHTPMYTAIGNHEVMGRYSDTQSLNSQYADAVPRAVAESVYLAKKPFLNPTGDPQLQADWIKNQSFNTDTYEAILSLPTSPTGGKQYYAVTFGDIRLIVLYVTNVWRTPSLAPDARGKYREREQDLNTPENWGYGQHIFEAIAKGSKQYTWLEQELNSPAFQQAKYKIVMFHHPPHSLGENSVPAYTDPIQIIDRDASGAITAIRYEYPQQKDYILRDLVPLLEKAGVQLVFYGHSHLWNRFISPSGMHFLESSNVGNSYGGYLGATKRNVPTTYQEAYPATDNPGGLQPVVPAIAPLLDANGQPQPYIASNDITVFSLFDTGTGTISSYYFDTRKPNSPVVKFDEFRLK
ncbi:Calcineurin-like phosphoesterase [Leptolyngbyaceae cyanobacterium JSC-12]|nr:Calcineurin-like phosphoesterase [Leptolyngbyaceae cyanobacterium JSC-12]